MSLSARASALPLDTHTPVSTRSKFPFLARLRNVLTISTARVTAPSPSTPAPSQVEFATSPARVLPPNTAVEMSSPAPRSSKASCSTSTSVQYQHQLPRPPQTLLPTPSTQLLIHHPSQITSQPSVTSKPTWKSLRILPVMPSYDVAACSAAPRRGILRT